MTPFQERIAGAGASSIAFVGLSRGAGKTTALRHAIAGLVEMGRPFGIASAGRRDEDLEAAGGPASLRLELPEGCVVATTGPALERATAGYETHVRIPSASSLGQILVARVLQAGEIEVVGPGTGPELQRTVETVRRHVDGPVLIEGSITRKAFTAPGVAEHLVLAISAGLSPSLERLIPAARYYLDLFRSPLAPPVATALFERSVAESRCLLTGPDWSELDSFHWQVRDNAPSLLGRADMKASYAVVPQIVTDDLVVPLLREGLKIGLVVRDPMRNALSPVYSSAWEKRGGGVTVIHRPKVLAIAANPVNPTGPDFEPPKFLAALSEGLADVPVHDVVQEAEALLPRKRWFGWG
jgi:hypothetical protein